MKSLYGIMTVLTVVLLWQDSRVLAELTVLQGDSVYYNGKYRSIRRLTCISEDDSSALVWNANSETHTGFHPPYLFKDSPTKRSTIDCAFDGEDYCWLRWNSSNNWSFTNSHNTPMGPVMDRRWEGFREYVSNGTNVLFFKHTNMGTRIFSIWGTVDLRILFCASSIPDSRCFWTAIGSKNGADSFIHELKKDGSFHGAHRIPGIECQRPQVSKHAKSSLSLVEWRTLTLKHREGSKIVEVYDEEQLILSCTYTGNITFNSTGLHTPTRMQLRLHNYVYLHTTNEHEQLQSPWLDVVDSNICLEMVVGMCTGCKLTVDMMSEKGHQVMMGHVLSKSSLNGDGLPQWQRVTFKTLAQNNFGNRVQFRVLTHLLEDDPSPLWTVANITICKAGGAVRTSEIQIWHSQYVERNDRSWPKVSCQKLSYNGGSLVISNHGIQHEPKHDVPWCEEGKVGPYCAIRCSSITADANCRKLSICNTEGCSCSQGWRGENCDEEVPAYLTAKSLAKGVVILEWSYPLKTNYEIVQYIITIERIASDLLQELSQEKISYTFHSIDKHEARYTKRLYLLPSTRYKFTVCPHMHPRQIDCIHNGISTLPAIAFGSDLEIAGNQSDHTIQVKLPLIANVTSGRHMHIILIGNVFCGNRTPVSDIVLLHINLTDSESAWVAASFETLGMKEQHFTIGDGRFHNGIFNCPLNPGETYDIVVIVEGSIDTTNNMTIVSNFLRVKLRDELTEPNLIWLISIPIIAALVLFTYYVYRKRNAISSQNNDIISMPLRTVNAENLYVDPHVLRRQEPHMAQSSEESTHEHYTEVLNDIYSS